MAASTARRLLARAHAEFDIEYGGFLSNHISHGIITLDKLHASAERMEKWYDEYTKHEVNGNQLEPAQSPSDLIIDNSNWRQFKGKRSHFPDLYQFFEKELSVSDSQTVVNKFLPELCQGVGGSAVHPLIHLGFSLDFAQSSVPLAEGLAYLVHSFLPLTSFERFTEMEEPKDKCTLKEVVVNLRNDKQLWNMMRETSEDGFQSKMKLLKDSSVLLSYLAKWDALHKKVETKEEQENQFHAMCEELARVSAFAFYYTEPPSSEFFLLHGVTGCYATICVAKTLTSHKDRMELLFYFGYTLLAVYVTEGCPNLHSSESNINHPKSPTKDWNRIVEEIIKPDSFRNDVHVMKLTYVCKRFEEIFGGDETWLHTAGTCVFSSLLDTKDFEFALGLKESAKREK